MSSSRVNQYQPASFYHFDPPSSAAHRRVGRILCRCRWVPSDGTACDACPRGRHAALASLERSSTLSPSESDDSRNRRTCGKGLRTCFPACAAVRAYLSAGQTRWLPLRKYSEQTPVVGIIN